MTSADLLETIVAATRHSVGTRERNQPLSAVDRRVARRPRGAAFRDALSLSPSPRVIAECKRRSPSRGILRRAYDPQAHAAAYERAGAAAVSVLTEPTFFDGSLQHLIDVRAAVSVPLLRKDFIVTEYQIAEAAAAGADAVLLIVAALDDRDLRALLSASEERGLAALVEVHDATELERAGRAGAGIVGVNSRDLRTLTVQPGILDALATRIPPGVIAVAESGIRSGTDLVRLEAAGYHAFLVGERLITQDDPGAALKELRSR